MNLRLAKEAEEPFVNALAKLSPFTRDFANPPLSLKQMRREAFPAKQVYVATDRRIVGFIWCRPMKPKHMPFSTVYYMGVDPEYRHMKIGGALLNEALSHAKNDRIELVCEDGNTAAHKFYKRMGMTPIKQGVVGKDERPYTRWGMSL